jgi:hypothetical protein
MPLGPGLFVLVAGGLLLPAAAAADRYALSPTARTAEPPPSWASESQASLRVRPFRDGCGT